MMSTESPKPLHLRPPSPGGLAKSNRSRSKEKDFEESPQMGPMTPSNHPVKVTIYEEPEKVELRTPNRSPVFPSTDNDSPFSTPRTLLSLSAPTTPSSETFLSEVTPSESGRVKHEEEEYDDEERVDYSAVKSEEFSNDERAALIAAVARHPDQNWHAILNDSQFRDVLANRTIQQCKEEFEAMNETVRGLSAIKAEKDRAGKIKQEEVSSETDDDMNDPSFVIRIPRNRLNTDGSHRPLARAASNVETTTPKKRGGRKRIAASQETPASKRQKKTRGGRQKRESRRRLPWSDVELIALKAGVAQYGRDWNSIKQDPTFGPLLVNRTQIAMRKQLTFGRAMKAFERQSGESTGAVSTSITHSADLAWSGEEDSSSDSKSDSSSSDSSSESDNEPSQASPSPTSQRLETLPEEASPSDRPSETDNSPPPSTPKRDKGRHGHASSRTHSKRSTSHEPKFKRGGSHASPSSATAAASLLRLDSAPKLSLGSSNREHPSSHDNSQANLMLQSYILLRDQLNVMSQANQALQNENMALQRRVMALENTPLMYNPAMNSMTTSATSFEEQKSQQNTDEQQTSKNKFAQPLIPTHHVHPSFVPTTTQVHSNINPMIWNPAASFTGSIPTMSPTSISPSMNQAQHIQQSTSSQLTSSQSGVAMPQQSFPSLNTSPLKSPSMNHEAMQQFLMQQQRQQQFQQQMQHQMQQQQQLSQHFQTTGQQQQQQQSPNLQPTAMQRTFNAAKSVNSDGSQRADNPRTPVSRHVTM